jgi:serine O-acetyltransferase
MPQAPRDLIARGRRQVAALQQITRKGHARRQWVKQRHTQSPPLRAAVAADVLATLRFRGEGQDHLSRTELLAQTVRLAWVSDAFLAQVLYRGRVAALRRGVPVIPRICHFASMGLSQVCIGDPVVIGGGLYLPHGQVVVDGITEVGSDVILFPWSTIGLRGGAFDGPRVEDGVHVGTGAKVVGPVRVGRGARLGANTVVVRDVAPGSTVVGVPGRARKPVPVR